MQKTKITITTIALIALISCVVVFYLSCKKTETKVITCADDCSPLSNAELAFICYTQGQKVIFKNDTTHILDTLIVTNKYTYPLTWECTSPCEGQGIEADFAFSQLEQFYIVIPYHNETPLIEFPGGAPAPYGYLLNVPTQTITVNSTTYNDIYSVLVNPDSAAIRSLGSSVKSPLENILQ